MILVKDLGIKKRNNDIRKCGLFDVSRRTIENIINNKNWVIT